MLQQLEQLDQEQKVFQAELAASDLDTGADNEGTEAKYNHRERMDIDHLFSNVDIQVKSILNILNTPGISGELQSEIDGFRSGLEKIRRNEIKEFTQAKSTIEYCGSMKWLKFIKKVRQIDEPLADQILETVQELRQAYKYCHTDLNELIRLGKVRTVKV
jgi:hypothetical protein